MTEALKPCPFCGDEPTVQQLGSAAYAYCDGRSKVWAYCLEAPQADTREEAIAIWNRLAGIAELEIETNRRVDGLIEELDRVAAREADARENLKRARQRIAELEDELRKCRRVLRS